MAAEAAAISFLSGSRNERLAALSARSLDRVGRQRGPPRRHLAAADQRDLLARLERGVVWPAFTAGSGLQAQLPAGRRPIALHDVAGRSDDSSGSARHEIDSVDDAVGFDLDRLANKLGTRGPL